MPGGKSIARGARLATALLTLLCTAAGCQVSVDHANKDYSCTLSPECPSGLDCVGGRCLDSSLSSDAGTAETVDAMLPATPPVRIAVASSSDDAEELVATGEVILDSSDLEMITEVDGDQIVAIRFQNIPVDAASLPTEAYIQFTTDEVSAQSTDLVIHAQAIGDAPTFAATLGDITLRETSAAEVLWSPPPWELVGEAELAQRTPNLAPLVQEVVARADWAPGNAIVFIVSGLGTRVASSYDLDPPKAPVFVLLSEQR